jgi:predicted Fe-S protein YdhL (DUF1289 family)
MTRVVHPAAASGLRTSPPAHSSCDVGASTPCIGVCRLDHRGYCAGCRRSGEEIARWPTMDDAERRRFMREILPARERP